MGTKQSSPMTSTQQESGHTATKAGTVQCNETENISTTMKASTIQPDHAQTDGPTNNEEQPVSALDVKITNALRELKKKRLQEDKDIHHDPFTKIMLKFPLVAQAFNSVRSTFAELDKGKKGYIVYADMEAAFERLGAEFSKEEMNQVFQESDMCENGKLTFKEFVVCLAIGFVLHKIPSLESTRFSIFYAPMSPKNETTETPQANKTLLFGEGNKLRVAFQLAIDAFLWFDVNGDGEISRNEMASRLNSSTQLHSPIKKKSMFKREKPPSLNEHSVSSMEIWERRFYEMDWNHDGSIQFKEFLMAFESWVGMDDEEEEKPTTPH